MKKKISLNWILKKLILSSFIILMLGTLTACETTDKKGKKKKNMDIPEWFLNPPVSKEALYATGYKKSKSLQLARDGAVDFARQELARIIGVKVSTMIKQFLEEAGVDNTTQLTEYSSIVSKSLASNVLVGSTTKEIELVKELVEENGKEIEVFKCYALVELTLDNLNKMVDDAIKENESDYAKLKADKAIEELEDNTKIKDTENIDKPEQPKYEE